MVWQVLLPGTQTVTLTWGALICAVLGQRLKLTVVTLLAAVTGPLPVVSLVLPELPPPPQAANRVIKNRVTPNRAKRDGVLMVQVESLFEGRGSDPCGQFGRQPSFAIECAHLAGAGQDKVALHDVQSRQPLRPLALAVLSAWK